MGQKRIAYLVAAAGIIVLLTSWGAFSDWVETVLKGDGQVRDKKVVYWTSSGSPEVDLRRARQFEAKYQDVNVEPNFRESGGLQDVLFVSFLSGKPPDYMDAKLNDLRKYILMGGLRPLDDLLAKEGPGYFDKFNIGRARIYNFRVNPTDYFLERDEDGNFKHPLEAARLLHMHGRAVGLRGVSLPSTITYNKRIFREAAKEFPEAGLVDEETGEPIPPETWLEYYKAAYWINEYGKAKQKREGTPQQTVYGVVLQGERQRDLMRGIRPLSWRAGTMAFDFSGDQETIHQHLDEELREKYKDQPIGHFNYVHPSRLAAFALLFKMDREHMVLPGTISRQYEDVRTVLAKGEAGMVIDGWHAALIGAERVPWAAQDLGSAPVPVPYHNVGDPVHGKPGQTWTEEMVAAEKQELYELLGLNRLGLEIPDGNKMPRAAADSIQFMTSACRSPQATWDWMHFAENFPELQKKEARRGTVPQVPGIKQYLDDREWFPYPYQKQVYHIIEEKCAMWPEKPQHGPVQPSDDAEVFYKWFYQKESNDLVEVLTKAREELEEFNKAANADLAQRIEDGITRPDEWTFADWDPKQAGRFFQRQQQSSDDPRVAQQLAAIREQLQEYGQEHPEKNIVGEDGEIRDDIWTFRPPDSFWQVLWIPALMLMVICAWFVTMAIQNHRANRHPLAQLEESRRNWYGYVFVLPGMFMIFAFAIYPSLYQFWLAAHKGDGLGVMQWAGWEHFNKIFNVGYEHWDSVFWLKVVPNTLMYMAVVTVGQLCLGLFFANMLNMPLRANRVYRVLYFIPLVTSLAIVSVILIGLLKGEQSGLNQFLAQIGIPIMGSDGRPLNWLGKGTDLWTVMAIGIWHGLPYNIILLLAGLQSISPDLYEAAKVDGANAWHRFWHITIPELLPILIVIAFQNFIGAARAFSLVLVLTEGGIDHSSELVATYVFKWGFMRPEGRDADLGYASALGITYSLLLAALTFTNVMIIAKRWKRRLAAEQRGMAAEREEASGSARGGEPAPAAGVAD